MFASTSAPLGTVTTFEQNPENLRSCGWKMDAVALTTNGSIKENPSLDASARRAVVRDAGGSAAFRRTLLVADGSVAAGGLGWPER